MLKKIITRPVLATVISILLVILGGISLLMLPVTKFPEIAPPTVVVTATYPGASAEVIAKAVAPPLENQINGVESMDYITSTSSDGNLTITVFFKLGTDPDQAAVNVQNRVAQVTSMLPAEVNQIGVTTTKRQASMVAWVVLYSESAGMDEVFIENYAKINVVPELKRIYGVGDAQVNGNKDYAMRVWLDPQKMKAQNISPAEVMAAIQAENRDAAPGKFGENGQESVEYTIRYQGKYVEPEQYENIVVRANSDGSSLLLKDLARVEFKAYIDKVITTYNGNSASTIGIFQTAGSNANEVAIAMNDRLEELSKSFPPGVKYVVHYSAKESLDQSIKQVTSTLIEAFILVFIVVFIFLQDFRSTLIPAIAVPVSIVGTFFFMQVFGFSINILTLFALVLAIGIVVDDAIVVVEAVHAKMEKKKLSPLAATMSAMSEITGAIISITLVMSAVFLPVVFMDGPTGLFYQQFALTLAIAIIISAINALTLSPALSALLLKNHTDNHDEHKAKSSFKERFFTAFNASFDRLTTRYTKGVIFLIKRKTVAFSGIALFIALFAYAFKATPGGFIPDEDQSFLIALVNNPPGSSQNRTQQNIEEAEKILRSHPAIETTVTLTGMNFMNNAPSSSAGVFLLRLRPTKERGEVRDINLLVQELQQALAPLQESSFMATNFPTVQGFGNTSGVEIVLQDRNSGSLESLNEVTQSLIAKLSERPEVALAFTTFNPVFPQYEMKVNEAIAKQLNLDVNDVLTTMQAYYGSLQASDFNRFGKYYRVVMQADAKYRNDPASLEAISIKNKLGQMVPIKNVVSVEPVSGPEIIEHFNLFNAVNITIVPKVGYSTGQAMAAVDAIKDAGLPLGYTLDWKGMAREERNSSGQTAYIFILCVVFVYFLLAAQYESYILPFAVVLTVPVGLLGVFIGVWFADLNNNIYVQVALIMLIGLLAKNAILIVEFALQRRRAGKTLVSAAIEGAKARLRPILMTSLAFIAGLLPLLFATGPSAIGNHSIGYSAVFGMLVGTILGVFITPVLFVVFQAIQEKTRKKDISLEDLQYQGDDSIKEN
ncbi:MAG: efflux RND transporter permease subunit [Sphingobacterium sp.]|nr:efflux RND transporter permease subunit [Sphingobacterium sp.]